MTDAGLAMQRAERPQADPRIAVLVNPQLKNGAEDELAARSIDYVAMETILADRAQKALATDSWTPAILRRIAAASGGDARRAINILRQAAAAAEQAGSSRLDLRLINPLLKQWHVLAEETRLTSVTEHEKMILQVAQTRGLSGTTALAQAYRTECRVRGLPPVAQRTFSKYISRMTALGLLRIADRPMAQGGRLVRVAKPGADRTTGGIGRSPSFLAPPRIRR